MVMAQLRLKVTPRHKADDGCTPWVISEVKTFEGYVFRQGEAGPDSSLPLY